MIITEVERLPDLSKYNQLVIDTETSGLYVHHGDRICGIAIGPVAEDWSAYLPIRHRQPNLAVVPDLGEGSPALFPSNPSVLPDPVSKRVRNLPPAVVFRWLKPYFENPSLLWVMHNASFDLSMFRAEGLEIRGLIFDTMIGAYVQDGSHTSHGYGLDVVAKRFLKGKTVDHTWMEKVEEWKKTQWTTDTDFGKIAANYSLAPVELLGEYACDDIRDTRNIFKVMLDSDFGKEKLTNNGNPAWSGKKLRVHEMELMRVLQGMNWHGMRMDVERLVELREQSLDEVRRCHEHMYAMAGHPFNVSSFKQMEKAFMTVGGTVSFWMKPKEVRGKQKLDQFTSDFENSTERSCWNSAAILKYLAHYKNVPGGEKAYEFLVNFREVDVKSRLISTYLDSYLKFTDSHGFLHPNLLQHGTRTGRLSSVSPNCQNISKTKGNVDQKAFEKFFGETDDMALGKQLRKLFIAREGHELVSIDYSQFEYRVATYLAQDRVMIGKFIENSKLDYHEATMELAGVSRDVAKAVNFGTLYGIGAKGLASLLSGSGEPTSVDQAKRHINKIFSARPALKKLIDRMSSQCKDTHRTLNPYGRVCLVPFDREYVGLNYWVQGTCGDAMRKVMVRIQKWIDAERWPIYMLLQIHDELLFDIPTGLVSEIAPKIVEIMCDLPEINVPFTCDIEVGQTWGTQEPLDKWEKLIKNPEKQLQTQRVAGRDFLLPIFGGEQRVKKQK